jgi:hypothetical protein
MLFLAGGTVAGWFWDKDTPNFAVMQLAASVMILTAVILFLAFWPFFWWVKFIRKDAHKGRARK